MNSISEIDPNDRVAVITPSYGPDMALCRTLNESVHEFFTNAKHYILIDKRDLPLFRSLDGPNTELIAVEEVLPRGFFRLPGLHRWMCPWTPRPLGGWLVQQIAKIASASLVDERVMLVVDSDTYFVRDIGRDAVVRSGRSRLFRADGEITPEMHHHTLWHKNACRLLGTTPDEAPMPDYIATIVSWDRQIVQQMTERVEQTTGTAWHRAVARTPEFSEFLLYGAFVDKVLGGKAPVWLDGDDRCLTYWDFEALEMPDAKPFVERLAPGDIAIMLSSHSKTSDEVRALVRQRATGGRLA